MEVRFASDRSGANINDRDTTFPRHGNVSGAGGRGYCGPDGVSATIIPFPLIKREPVKASDPLDELALQNAFLELTAPGSIIYESSVGWIDTAPSEMPFPFHAPEQDPA